MSDGPGDGHYKIKNGELIYFRVCFYAVLTLGLPITLGEAPSWRLGERPPKSWTQIAGISGVGRGVNAPLKVSLSVGSSYDDAETSQIIGTRLGVKSHTTMTIGP